MIRVYVSKQLNYPISSVKVKKFLVSFFKNNGIVSDASCTVSFVNENKMKEIGKKYYKKDDRIHNVFSFVESEVKDNSHFQQKGVLNLGEIIVCFPVVVKEATSEGKLIEDKVLELVEHSALHLLGVHHKE